MKGVQGKKIEQTLDILDAKGLHSLVEHSYSVEPSSWEIQRTQLFFSRVQYCRIRAIKTTNQNAELSVDVQYIPQRSVLNNGKILSNKASESFIAILLSELNAEQQLWGKFPQFIDLIA